jgi:hypothetical protein
MPTKEEWKAALIEAIAIWSEKARIGEESHKPCPLCCLPYKNKKYHEDLEWYPCSEECPVARQGYPTCDNTPFYEVHEDDDPDFSNQAQREVEFLVKILNTTNWEEYDQKL